jgi:hypothetical protein
MGRTKGKGISGAKWDKFGIIGVEFAKLRRSGAKVDIGCGH